MADFGILKRLEEVEEKFNQLEEVLSSPDITPPEIHKYSKERSELSDIVSLFREYKKTLNEYEESATLLDDPEMGELVKEDLEKLKERLTAIEGDLRVLLLPKDPNDTKNVILEIRSGTGGDEAALFAADLFRMYSRFAERKGWKLEVMNLNETGIGGLKEVIAAIEGKNVYELMKFESGVHRVQRVPTTEASGRIHTSTATVVALPEPDELDDAIEIEEKDLRVDTYRASGPGGQHVNKTDSAVRITHLPSGIVTQCQDERSQHKNRARAMRMLRAKLYELEVERQQGEITSTRKSIVGSGARSEKIRTYNFPQGRVTDHRIGLTLHKLEYLMEGEIDELLEALKAHEQMERLHQSIQG